MAGCLEGQPISAVLAACKNKEFSAEILQHLVRMANLLIKTLWPKDYFNICIMRIIPSSSM
jgi:hypothetical protein